ncbi:MAG: ATP-dependent DNA helicase RecG [Bacteroidetes bacterium]|nr:MAG: ATP-dependent DNA helicase RecG [Bacteroidota bacterium]
MSVQYLDTDITYLKGVGPKRADVLNKELGVFKFGDLLSVFPFRYVDRTKFYKIRDIKSDLPFIQLKGTIVSIETLGKPRQKRLVALFKDDTGMVELVWFRGISWIRSGLRPNTEYIVFGRPNVYKGKVNIPHPEMDPANEKSSTTASSLQAVYPSTEKLTAKGLNSKGIGNLLKELMSGMQESFPEPLSDSILKTASLTSKKTALINIHFPKNPAQLNKAQYRLKFEELFFIQLRLLMMRDSKKRNIRGFPFLKVGELFNKFYKDVLPFELTGAQKRVVKEIRDDIGSGKQMNRLLQGDVGSGKTLVALMSMLIALDNDYQACMMAPTEILANQHFKTISQMIEPLGIKVALLTGSTKTAKRKELHAALESGEINILLGTHALIEDKVKFGNLGMVIIDEQHRFGVAQRARLWKKSKGNPPHILIMTATPIPRTLAMTLYGDLDVSIIDELPPGRKDIKTIHRYDSSRLKVFGFMKEEIKKGRQIYVVYPLIQESEKLDYKDLMDGYESISREFPIPEYQISIVHGKMKSDVKEFEMQRFVSGKTQIMVATNVIEVGVDVANATVMVLESAERFGLSQLHQLRGRVGRGAEQSYCILMTDGKLTGNGKLRMETMVHTNDGFEIAEVDMKLRGPGDLEGTQQSGTLELKIADIVRDGQIIQYAREIATKTLEKDPMLKSSSNSRVANHLAALNKHHKDWSQIS